VLADTPLSSRLSRQRLERVALLGRNKRYVAQATIVREGESGDAFYLILDGRAAPNP